ncbi:MAG TPA: DUF3772 domain-containing protein, partial [Paracoccus sp. (in: a-proteobacteria)]|nr:DUF3772 domain-containing protein [Paracoccus sp. (in: a-proteobacteria)]
AELQAPGVRAQEAFSRADSVVQAVDELQRNRQASAVLHLSPSPLLPGSWRAAATEGLDVARDIAQDFRERLGNGGHERLRDRLPEILGFLLGAGLLLVFGRRWIDRLTRPLFARASEYSRDVLAFVVSLTQIAVPAAGVYLAVRAVDATGLVGEWGRPILMALPLAGLILFGGGWLARRFFPLSADPPICYPEGQQVHGRRLGAALAVVLAAHEIAARALLPQSGLYAVQRAEGALIPQQISDAAAGVWHLPLILLGALFLFRLSLILRGSIRHGSAETPGYRLRIVATVGSVGRLVALAAPVLALIGYVSMANALLWPTVESIGLIGLIILLQEFIADVYALAKRGAKGSRDALAPVLIGFALVVLSLPLFALIWGARGSDLDEAWTRLRQGIRLGGVQLSPGAILTFAAVFVVGFFLTRLIQGTFRNSILPRTRLDAGAQNAAVAGLGYVGIFLAALLAVTAAGIDLSSLAIVAGALSVGIGFGLQNIVSNFVSGIILLVERPITVGDWIQVGGAQGYVKRISVRSTQIQTFDRTDVIVPNSDLVSQQVTNWTHGNQQGRIIVPVNVAYGSDTRKVAQILTEIAEDQPTVLINPAPVVAFTGFGTDALNFELRAVLSDINQGIGVSSEIRHQILERFAAEGLQIPWCQREIRTVTPYPIKLPAADKDEAQATRDEPVPPPKDQDPRISSAASGGIEEAAGGESDGDGARG